MSRFRKALPRNNQNGIAIRYRTLRLRSSSSDSARRSVRINVPSRSTHSTDPRLVNSRRKDQARGMLLEPDIDAQAERLVLEPVYRNFVLADQVPRRAIT